MNSLKMKLQQQREIFEGLFDYFISNVPHNNNCTVAEYGVGKWGFGRFYAECYKKTYGIDIEDYSAYQPGVEFVISDGTNTPIENRSIDIVFSHSVLEHVKDLNLVLSDMDRLLKIGGYLYLTVNPLYYSSFGAHLYENGERVENWQHLDPEYKHYLTDEPLPNAKTRGHYLNKLTASIFLSAVGSQPWEIIRYYAHFETKSIPLYVNSEVASLHDLKTKAFKFIGRKICDL